jgi:tetratricopeptide (TPR) repeat protein
MQKLEDAEKGFDRAELLYKAGSNLEGQTEVLFQRGYLASKARKLEEARSQFEKALTMALATGNEFQRIAATLELSSVAQVEGKIQEAEQKANEGIEMARRSGIAVLEDRGLVNLGNAYLGSFNYPAAEARFREAWEAARRASMPRPEARAAFSLGSVHAQQSKPREALAEAQASRAFYQAGGYLLETRLNDLLIARAHRLLGELDSALEAFDSAFKLSEVSKDVPMMESAQAGRAGVLADKESYPEAVKAYEKAIELGTTLHDSTRVFLSTVNRGKALWRIGRYDEAAKAFSDGEALARSPGGPQNRLWLLAANRTEMADSQGRAHDAVTLGREALKLAGAEPVRVATVKSILGLALAHAGSIAEGQMLAREGLALSPRDDAGLVAAARLRLAEVQLAGGDTRAAQASLTQVLEELGAHPQPISVFRATALAARAARKAGDSEREARFSRQANDVLISLQSTLGDSAFITFSSRPDMRSWIALARNFR